MSRRRRIDSGGGGGAPAFTTEYQAVLDFATLQGYTLPSISNRINQNALLAALKTAGVFAQLDAFYCFRTDGDANFAKINWVDPLVGLGVAQLNLAFAQNSGFSSFGGQGRLVTIAPTACVKMLVSSTSMFYDYTVTAAEGQAGVFNNGTSKGLGKYASGNFLNGTINSIVAPVGTSFRLYDFSGGTLRGYKDGVAAGSAPYTGDYKSAFPFWVGERNDEGVAGPLDNGNVYGCLGLGASVNANQAALYSAWSTYKAATGPSLLDNEYLALLLIAAGLGFGLPDPPTQLKQSNFISSLKGIDVWNKLDALWLMASSNNGIARLNLKDPSNHQAIMFNAPAFTPDEGFYPDGFVSYLDLNWIPSVHGVNYQQNDSSILFASFTNANLGVNDRPVGAWDLTRALQLVPRHGADQASYSLNDGTFIPSTGTVPDSSGIFQVQRINSSSSRLFRNGVLVGGTTAPSNGRPTVSPYAGAVNFNGAPALFSSRNIALVGFGSSMVGQEQQIADVWNSYLASL